VMTILIIHHANKDGQSRGASAFHDGVRCRYELGFISDKDGKVDADVFSKGLRKVIIKKDNWGIRKYLWKLTDGKDDFIIKVAPTMIREQEITYRSAI